MPFIDFDASRREADAAAEPITMRIAGKDWEFPGAMPAEVGVQDTARKRLQRDLPDDMDPDAEVPDEFVERARHLNEATARAVLGEHHDELQDLLPAWDFQDLIQRLMLFWLSAQSDPTRLRRLNRIQRAKTVVPVTIVHDVPTTSNGHSSSSTGSSRRISGASTASTSPVPSPGNGSPGVASSRSSGGSRARP